MQRVGTSYRALGALWVVFGIMCALEAAWIFLNRMTLRLMWGVLLDRVPNPFPWMSFFDMMVMAVMTLLVITTIFSFVGAVSLIQAGPSQRVLAIVASILGMLCGPLGIALGVFTLVMLLRRPAEPVFERMPAAA